MGICNCGLELVCDHLLFQVVIYYSLPELKYDDFSSLPIFTFLKGKAKQAGAQRNIYTLMFIAVLFTTPQR